MKHNGRRVLLVLQSAYDLLAGLWPLIHITSFMQVTGYKTDLWLVKIVGLLFVCVALAFLTDLLFRETSRAIAVLSISTAAAILAIDVYYSLTDVISDIYLADAAIQLVFIGGWGIGVRSGNI